MTHCRFGLFTCDRLIAAIDVAGPAGPDNKVPIDLEVRQKGPIHECTGLASDHGLVKVLQPHQLRLARDDATRERFGLDKRLDKHRRNLTCFSLLANRAEGCFPYAPACEGKERLGQIERKRYFNSNLRQRQVNCYGATHDQREAIEAKAILSEVIPFEEIEGYPRCEKPEVDPILWTKKGPSLATLCRAS